ncbi:MAG: type 2 lanthipeptide synthetase LanM family protein [Solibacillus sp.]|uniref:type 2 lanthipeptide synthetase LanM family protein n=1 Tax=Solibacillus sp. TaxID=1909654 RepID=UPI00331496D2
MLDNLYLSLNIKERYSILKTNKELLNDLNTRALDSWRSEMSILTNSAFAEMISINNYNLNVFSHVVDKDVSAANKKLYQLYSEKSEWYQKFVQMVNEVNADKSIHFKKDILFLLRPYTYYVEKSIDELLSIPLIKRIVGKEIKKCFVEHFAITAIEIAQKPIVLELNIDREKGELSGESKEDRFKSFIDSFSSNSKLLSFYNKYIVLTRLLTDISLNYIKNAETLLKRIEENKDLLSSKFGITDFVLEKVKMGQGDTHGRGNTVTELVFKDSTKIIYKPKNVKIHKVYKEFVDIFNKKENILEMQVTEALHLNDYTFEEFIEYKGCNNNNEVNDYYRRFGQLMGILYFLNGTDMHMENLISRGNQPIVVDLETLFQQPIPFDSRDYPIMKDVRKILFGNVTSTMLLPVKHGSGREDDFGVDLSALDGKASKLPRKVLQPVNLGTDEMKYDFKEVSSTDSNNIPFLKDPTDKVYYKDFTDEIFIGFKNVVLEVMRNKDEFLDGLWLKTLQEDILVRTIFRDTSQYGNILEHSNHPDLLMDMLDRDKVLENMWSFGLSNKEVIYYEIEDMRINDIPIFFSNIKENNLLSSNLYPIEGERDYNSLTLVTDKINNIDNDVLDKQLSVIKVALGLYPRTLPTKTAPLISDVQYEYDFIEEAKIIADFLIENITIEDDKYVYWMSVVHGLDVEWEVGYLDNDFYDGIAGVYLFFESLYLETKIKKYKEYAKKIVNSLKMNFNKNTVGLSSGYVGLIHATAYIKNRRVIREISEDLQTQFTYLENDHDDIPMDYLNGTPSLINSLLKIYQRDDDMDVLLQATKYAEKYMSLPVAEEMKSDLGFGHGYLSIALVFYRLWNITDNVRYCKSAEQYYSYFESSYEAEKESLESNLSWCRGLLGVLIGQLEIYQITKGEKHLKIINELEEIIFKMNELNDDGLCHGNIAYSEFFVKKYEYFDSPTDFAHAKNIVQNVLNSAKEGFKLRKTDGFQSLGLFTGLSGIGYQLLRVNNPKKINSILD